MKKYLLLLTFAIALSEPPSIAGYPEEWAFYTSGACVYDIQSGRNDRDMSETAFLNYLSDLARTNIARAVRVSITDIAELSRQAVDGRTSTEYSSLTTFSTDMELNLVKTVTDYDRNTGTGYAIAYIVKQEAMDFYHNEIVMAFDRMDGLMSTARNLASEGMVPKAREALSGLEPIMEEVRSYLFMLNYFGAAERKLADMSARLNGYAGEAGRLEAEFSRGVVLCLNCRFTGDDRFGLERAVKGVLADKACSFTDRSEDADWLISLVMTVREYGSTEIGGVMLYTAYADAELRAEKKSGVGRVVEDRISEKGTHTMSYEEAERDACARLGTALAERIYSLISQ